MLYKLERASRTMCKVYSNSGGKGLPPKLCWLIDCSGFGTYLLHTDYSRMTYNLAVALNNHYPERLGVIWVVNAPWIFSTFWRICSAFVDSETYKKLVLIPSNDGSYLLQHIDADQLEIPFGGTNPFKFNEEYVEALIKEEEEWMKENKELSHRKFDIKSLLE